MSIHFQKELENLKKRILSLGSMVEDRVRMAIKAIDARDGDLAKKIIAADREIDEIEVEVEEECLKILALHQPVAGDLRFITAIIKINNDLERIGDEAVNIAERVASIAKHPSITLAFDFSFMAEKTESMLKRSLDALVNLDEDTAYEICVQDDEIDDMNREVYDKVKKAISDSPEQAGPFINFFLVARHLERIADHATNIAEEVIYMVKGIISRHQKAGYMQD